MREELLSKGRRLMGRRGTCFGIMRLVRTQNFRRI